MSAAVEDNPNEEPNKSDPNSNMSPVLVIVIVVIVVVITIVFLIFVIAFFRPSQTRGNSYRIPFHNLALICSLDLSHKSTDSRDSMGSTESKKPEVINL